MIKRLASVMLASLLTFSLFFGLTYTTNTSLFASADGSTAKMMYFRYHQTNASDSFKMLFPCQAGKKYLLSYKMRTSGAGDFDITAESFNGSVVAFVGSSEGEQYTHNIKVNVTSGDNFSFVITPKKSQSGVNLYFDGYITDIVLRETDNDYVPINDTNVASGFGDFSEWTGTKCANLIKYKKAPVYSVYCTGGFSYETGKLFDLDANLFKSDAHQNNTFYVKPGKDWFYIWQYLKIEPNKNYELSYNWKVNAGTPGIYLLYYTDKENRLKPENGNCTRTVDEDYNKITYKFSTPSNIRIDENLTFALFTSSKTDSYYFANPELYEVDSLGNRIGKNLVVDDHFTHLDDAYADSAQSAWYFLKNSSWEVTFKDDLFFENKTPRRIEFDGAKGDLSQFATVEENQLYAFSFNYKFKDASKEPEPVIEYYTSTGSYKADITDSFLEEDEYKATYRFIVPGGLKKTDNIRVGVRLPDDGSYASFAEFSLKKASSDSSNILHNPQFTLKKDIVDWNTEETEKWLLHGDFPDESMKAVFLVDGFFAVNSENLLMGMGKSTRTDALWGLLYQDLTLKPGSRYVFSFKAKFANTGNKVDNSGTEYNKMGPCISYYSQLYDKYLSVSNAAVEEDDKEYKTTYQFTMPTDTITGQGNFVVQIWLTSDYVSGYFTGLQLYEADSNYTPIGENIIQNGSFETGDLSSWSQSGQFSVLSVHKTPENFFSKTTPAKDCMLQYRNPSSWAHITQDVSLKSNTRYALYSKQKHTMDDPVNPARITFQALQVDKDGFIPSERTVDESTGVITQILTTPELRFGYNLKIFLYIISVENAGFWGPLELYELDENDHPIGNQLLLNNNFAFGLDGWEVYGTTIYRKCEVPDGFFTTPEVPGEKMIYSKGVAQDQAFGQNVKLKHGKTYIYSGKYVSMNASGVHPQIRYKALDGTDKTLPLESSYDAVRYYFEAEFTLPDDAKYENGYADVRVEMTNASKGKGYFCDLMLNESDKYVNLLSNAQFGDALIHWYTTGNFVLSDYDPEVFVFYYDDERFDDGNWSGQVTARNVGKGSLKGNLLDTDNKPIANAEILATNGKESYREKTDRSGEFSFASLPADEYSLYVIYQNSQEYCTKINIRAGVTMIIQNIRFVLEDAEDEDDDYEIDTVVFEEDTDPEESYPEEETGPLDYGVVNGKYFDKNAKNPEGVTIYFGRYVKVDTDKNGEFTVPKIPEGKYEVYLIKNGKKKVLKTIRVLNGKAIRVVLREKADDPQTQSNLWIVFVIVGVALLIAAGITSFIVIRKRGKR